MNQNFTSEQVYNFISGTANNFSRDLTGSNYWRIREKEVASTSYNISGVQINLWIKEFMKSDGTPVLPQNPINKDWLRAGSYFGIVEISIPGEHKFSIHAPHSKPEDQFHLKKGRERVILYSPAGSIVNYSDLLSGLFLMFNTKEEVIKYIEEMRKI